MHSKAYSFIALARENNSEVKSSPSDLKKKLVDIESVRARQNILEAKLVVLEDELHEANPKTSREG